jgi:hypothetical protein
VAEAYQENDIWYHQIEQGMKTYYTILTIVLILLAGCVSMREKKSEKYYLEHEEKIGKILVNYNDLYNTQPFNLGFSERDYSKIGIDIMTDSIRYAITNQQFSDAIRETVVAFGYDTAMLRRLYTNLYDIRSIWLGKDEMFHKGGSSQVTYLSFRSVAGGSPFLDRKYYTLVMFDPTVLDDELRSILNKQGFSLIKGNVYFKIMGRFR